MANANKKRRTELCWQWILSKKDKCEICGLDQTIRDEDGYVLRRKNLTIHHIDGDITNNDPSNHQTLCRKCHDEVEKEKVPLTGKK